MSEVIVETESAIVCHFDPSLYISHRRACLFYVINTYRDRIPDEVITEIYRMNLWEADNIETALAKLKPYIGKTIITRPATDPDNHDL